MADYVTGDFARAHVITIPTGSDPLYPRPLRRLAAVTGLCAYGDSAGVSIFDGSPDEDEELFFFDLAMAAEPSQILAGVGPAPSRVTVEAPVDGHIVIWQHYNTGDPEPMFSGPVSTGVATDLARGVLAGLLISVYNPLLISYLDNNGDPIADTITVTAYLDRQDYSEGLADINPWGVVTVRPDGLFRELLPPGGWLGVAPFGADYYTADTGTVFSLEGGSQALPFVANDLSLAGEQLVLRERREGVDYHYTLTPAIIFNNNRFTLI